MWIKQLRKEDGDQVEGSKKPRRIHIGGKATVFMGRGDHLIIETPGGGAWGSAGKESDAKNAGKGNWGPRGSLAEREKLQAGF
jgi:5-oxoprolinase (ATP-hydrolysing)